MLFLAAQVVDPVFVPFISFKSDPIVIPLHCGIPHNLSHRMGKPTICIGKNKDTDQLRGSAKLISAFVFATRIVQFLFYLHPKFQASSSFLRLYRTVCVGPGRKPHCWFSHEAAQFIAALYNHCYIREF